MHSGVDLGGIHGVCKDPWDYFNAHKIRLVVEPKNSEVFFGGSELLVEDNQEEAYKLNDFNRGGATKTLQEVWVHKRTA